MVAGSPMNTSVLQTMPTMPCDRLGRLRRQPEPEHDEPTDEDDDDEDDVDRTGRHPRGDARDGHLDGHALAGDHVVAGVAAVAPVVAHPAMLTRRACAATRRLGCAGGPRRLPHGAPAPVAAARGARRAAPADGGGGRRAARPLPAGLDPPVGGALGQPRPVGGHLPVGPCWPGRGSPRPVPAPRRGRTCSASSPAPSPPRCTAPAGGGARRPLASVALAALVGLVGGRTTPRCGPAR